MVFFSKRKLHFSSDKKLSSIKEGISKPLSRSVSFLAVGAHNSVLWLAVKGKDVLGLTPVNEAATVLLLLVVASPVWTALLSTLFDKFDAL